MNPVNILTEELFCTRSHEWISFHDTEAFIGITGHRVAGAKQVKRLEFIRIFGFKKRGEVFANIQLNSRRFEVRMPVDGSIISVNDPNLLVQQQVLLNKPETEGWLVKILVSQPCERKGLIPFEEYNSKVR